MQIKIRRKKMKILFFSASIFIILLYVYQALVNRNKQRNDIHRFNDNQRLATIQPLGHNNNNEFIDAELAMLKLNLSRYVLQKKVGVINLSAKINVTSDSCPILEFTKENKSIPVNVNIYCIQDAEKTLRNSSIRPGGLYAPTNCTARYKVAIIIPYRNRAQMLAVFLNHMHPFLMQQHLDYGIYIVEPKQGLKFNRGLLLNIGFLESLKLTNDYWDCFIFHDVDLLPEDERNYYSCPPEAKPRHMSSLVSTMDYKLPYDEIFGGVSALTRSQFEKINGYSNLYFGWGGEDDDLRTRIVNSCLKVSRYPLEIGTYLMINHEKDKNPNPHRYTLMNDVFKNMKNDGINSIVYNTSIIKRRRLYTHIVVTYDEKNIIMNKYDSLNLTNLSQLEVNNSILTNLTVGT